MAIYSFKSQGNIFSNKIPSYWNQICRSPMNHEIAELYIYIYVYIYIYIYYKPYITNSINFYETENMEKYIGHRYNMQHIIYFCAVLSCQA